MATSRLKQETSGRTRHRKGQPSAVTDWEMIRKRRQEREKHRQTTSNRHKKTKVNDMQDMHVDWRRGEWRRSAQCIMGGPPAA